MGCDIHLTMEYTRFTNQDGTPYWDAFCENFNPGRDYCMFDVISGVRGDSGGLFPDRGLPEDISYDAKRQFFARSAEEGEPTDEPDPDIHSVTWLTTDEYMACIVEAWLDPEVMEGGSGPGVAYQVIGVTLQAFKDRGLDARVIIGFDN
jgi:hypothetical protein